MTDTLKTPRTTARRLPERGSHDRETIHAILDEGLFCHIAFAVDGQPYAIPTGYGRDGRRLYIHGSSASRMLRSLSDGVSLCLTVTLLDGIVLARSAFHHSINYRSVMVLGVAHLVTDDAEKLHCLEVITDHIAPGRWADARPPTRRELKATAVLRLDIEEASAKVRAHGVKDDPEDLALPIWAGVLPMRTLPGDPQPDADLAPGAPVPAYVSHYRRPAGAP